MAIARLLTLTCPLGDDVLDLVNLTGYEQLGFPYVIDLEVLSADVTLTGADLLTKQVTAHITQSVAGAQVVRHFHGVVVEFDRLGPADVGRSRYHLQVVPALWRMGLAQHSRVFQAMTVKDIVGTLLSEHGLPSAQWGILPDLQAIDYCTQFNETDLHFFSRLLEEHGLSYYFTHTATDATLHVSSTAAGFPTYEGGDVSAQHDSVNFLYLTNWERVQRARTAQVQLKDMDAQRSQPSVVLDQEAATRVYAQESAPWSGGVIQHWPGGMSTRPGLKVADVWMGSIEADSELYRATALDPRYVSGARLGVSVMAEDGSETKQSYVVTETRHVASDESSISTGGAAGETCSVALGLVAASRTWMPRLAHARPVMSGLYSAKVTGPSGEKIHVDEYGRIKIKFRWDTRAGDDDTTSCWVRVAQSAAGAWGGTWFLPRVGDEVLVAFLDGDPDRPVVTGSVYGKDAKPPFHPGDNRAQSGVRTRSYKSDSEDDANILRFEDKKGSEEVLLHAQKDLTVSVENDETRTVDNARTTTIDKGNDTLTLKQGNRSESIKMGNDGLTVEMGNGSAQFKMGDYSIKCDLGSITLEAMQKITLKVGSSTIELDQTGITLKGMMIKSEATMQNSSKGMMVQSEASAMSIVKGAIVMIN